MEITICDLQCGPDGVAPRAHDSRELPVPLFPNAELPDFFRAAGSAP